MRLRVLQVAYPFAPVCPGAVGGAEQVLSAIDRGLVHAGHHSLVVACEGSEVEGRLMATVPAPDQLNPTELETERSTLRKTLELVLRTHAIDLVHFHGVDFPRYLPDRSLPMLATLHLPVQFYPEGLFSDPPDQLILHGVSDTQHRTFPTCRNLHDPIPNGVDLDQFTPRLEKEDYLLALGRICPEKGYHHALEAAHAANLRLLLAGHVFPYPEHYRYFEHRILPLLDEKRRFIGAVGPVERSRLLAGARAVVIPSLIDETSSLVGMEALASATPVVALRRGALSEIVEHGRTGILVDHPAQLCDAILASRSIDPRACRQAAERRFASTRMIGEYLALYKGLARRLADVG